MKTKKKVIETSSKIFKGKFKSSKKLVLEEFLEGEEASYFLIVDNNSYKFFDQLKTIRGYMKMIRSNTGGMGAYSPAAIIDKNEKR